MLDSLLLIRGGRKNAEKTIPRSLTVIGVRDGRGEGADRYVKGIGKDSYLLLFRGEKDSTCLHSRKRVLFERREEKSETSVLTR